MRGPGICLIPDTVSVRTGKVRIKNKLAQDAGTVVNVLSIGGSDPSSGAGIQSDVRLFEGLGASCLTVVTAVTAQNTSRFGNVEPVSAQMIGAQLDAILDDFEVDAVKIGMVYDSQAIRTIHGRLKSVRVPVIVDPVIKSTTGGMLLRKTALGDLKRYIVPLATAITPNRFEAGIISGVRGSPESAAERILQMGAKSVIITGVERGGRIADLVAEKDLSHWVYGKKTPGRNRGSGCMHSGTITYWLGCKRTLREAAQRARDAASSSITASKKTGKGIPIVAAGDQSRKELAAGIKEFLEIRDVGRIIPECQTNFVYAKAPKTAKDVLGIAGRIVRTGSGAIVAGELEYGGSKHVAAALVAASKRFPETRSAANMRYHKETVRKAKRKGMEVAKYDRSAEPENIKTGGSSVRWGIGRAVRDLKRCPDIVFHEGDHGKEPMILVFGKSPRDVTEKIQRIV